MLYFTDVRSFEEKLHNFFLVVALLWGRIFGLFPFKCIGSQIVPINIKLQVVASLSLLIFITYGSFQVGMFCLSTVGGLRNRPEANDIYLRAAYAAQCLAYYLNILSLSFITLFRRREIFKIFDDIAELKQLIKTLKAPSRLQKMYFYELWTMYGVMGSVYTAMLVFMIFKFIYVAGWLIVVTLILHLWMYVLLIGTFFSNCLYFTYCFEVITEKLLSTENKIQTLNLELVSATFTNESCELSDLIELLAKLQLKVHICMKKVTRFLQMPILCILFLMLIGCIMQVTDIYTYLNQLMLGQVKLSDGLFMAPLFLVHSIVQLHFIARGPELALRQHKKLVEALNSIASCKIEWRLERSVSCKT